MQGRERTLVALWGERPDRVPIFLRDLTLGLDLCDFSTPEVSAGYDAARAAQAVLASQARFHQDAVVGWAASTIWGWTSSRSAGGWSSPSEASPT